ncbi:MAG TPA: hypothetical protein VFB06_05980 [Streptosporangiaceae bacterium]|nr:hypothetical protein [Streptosporangiaceae bacterium]
MRKPRNRQRAASPFTLLIPRGNRGCYPPGPDAADSDCYQSDADLADGCYGSGPSVGSGAGSAEELLRSLITPRHPRRR